MWDALAGPYLAAAGLLVLAGVPKVVDPAPLVRALRSAGFTVRPAPGAALVRAFAVAEVVVGAWAVVAPSRLVSALVAAAYAVFSAFVALVLARGGVLGSCGCFGKPDTPPSRVHLALTGVAALVAAAVAVAPPVDAWRSPAGTSTLVTTVGLAVVIGFLAWMTMAVLPTTTATAVRSATRTRSKG